MSQVLCTCKKCTYIGSDDGNDYDLPHPGRWVSSSTRNRHRQQAPPMAVVSGARAVMPQRKAALTGRPGKLQSPGAQPKLLRRTPRPREMPNSGTEEAQALAASAAIQLLVVWLYLYAGISRAAANIVLKVLQLILGGALAGFTGLPPSSPKLPGDIRTAIKKLAITPEIHRRLCCSRCFTLYPLETEASNCTWREISDAQECGKTLWRLQWGAPDAPRRVPERVYSYQTMTSWLEFMLSLPSFEHLVDSPLSDPLVSNGICYDVWHSRMWQELGDYTIYSGNLIFTFYIDWFNPFTNKIAGKKVSMGVIILACLNLPPEFRYKSEYLFVAGITPGPHEPSMVTINNILEPLMNELQQLDSGTIIKTSRSPEGRRIRVRVIPIIADLVALRKVTGFASHSATLFCSFCKLPRNDITSSDPRTWTSRTHSEVLKASEDWVKARTLVRRKLLVKKTGVRFSLFHRLQYRNSVKHNVIGIMHNWLEGVLQHHLRSRWGLDSSSASKVKKGKAVMQPHYSMSDDGDNESNDDVGDLDIELQELRDDGDLHSDTPAHRHRQPRRTSRGGLTETDLGAWDSDNADPDYYPMSDRDSNGIHSADLEISEQASSLPLEGRTESMLRYPTFDESAILEIRAAISDVFLPTWMDRPPKNLGDPSHGKLKADNYFVLFTAILPLHLMEYWTQAPLQSEMLRNFCDLVTCTNIICSYTSSELGSRMLALHYKSYSQSSPSLFQACRIVPNHHYAYHIPEQLLYWGPLMHLSEFAFERQNGLLQKFNSNNHPTGMDYTLLKRHCERARHLHIVSTSLVPPSGNGINREAGDLSGAIAAILFPHDFSEDLGTAVKNGRISDNQFNTLGEPLEDANYDKLVICLQADGVEVFHRKHRGPSSQVQSAGLAVPRFVVTQRSFTVGSRKFTCRSTHPGNAAALFHTGGVARLGFINTIWDQSIGGVLRKHVLMTPLRLLDSKDNAKNPFLCWPGLACGVVYNIFDDDLVISPKDIIAHAAFRVRPASTFNIDKQIVVFHNLDRGRKIPLYR